MLRIVLDTNCLLQILGAQSKYHFLFSEFLKGNYKLCVSTEILFEYEEILSEKASPVAADLFLKVISRSRNVERKDPYFRLGIIKQDKDDNKFVDCAFVCQADYIVTDDKHFSDASHSPFPRFKVIGLDEFALLLNS
ncbi:MAG: putative toxin-antitoxin system toxin component, PIN family [Prevotella sp.]|nr:putative toxin-antitoxin system toxin component, PIN family [Prevotella sp.]